MAELTEPAWLKVHLHLIEQAKQRGEIPAEVDSRKAAFLVDSIIVLFQTTLTSKYLLTRYTIYTEDDDPDRILRTSVEAIKRFVKIEERV